MLPQERHQRSTRNSSQPQPSRNLPSNGDELTDRRSTGANRELLTLDPRIPWIAVKLPLERNGEGRRDPACRGGSGEGLKTIPGGVSVLPDELVIWIRTGQPARRRLANSASPTCRRQPGSALLDSRAIRSCYSITSSARAKSDGCISMPSALAVFRLITNSNFVGCRIGRSAGFAPFRMRPAYTPACRYCSVMLGP